MALPNKENSFLQSPVKAFFYAVKPFRVRFVIMILFAIVGNAFAYLLPYFLKLIADKVSGVPEGSLSMSDFYPLLFIITGVLIGQELCLRIGHYLETTFVVKSFDRITSRMFEFLLNRPLAYFEEKFSGELTRRVEQVGSAVKFFIELFPWEVAWPLLAAVMTTILLFNANFWLGVVFIAWFKFFCITSFIILRIQFFMTQKVSEKHADLSGTLVDVFSNVSLVHTFAAHEYEYTHYRRFMNDAVSAENSERRIGLINRLQQSASLVLLGFSLTITSVFLFTKGLITVGDFIIVGATISTFVGIVFSFGEIVVRGIREYGEINNAIESLNSKVTLVKDGDHKLVIQGEAAIGFENVSFSYGSSGKEVLHNFTLRIEPGQKVGLVGKSGAGKSTLVKLLLRSYDVGTGKVQINDQNVSSLELNSLRSAIAFVPQDTALFHRTLYENILYAKPSATKDEILSASISAHAHDFIQQYPNTYDTLVGERGVKLSGGQRQRIALARAMLKNAPILVLDEATSALDSESEEVIQKGLEELFKKRTVLAIAHRLSTLRAMDRIIVLEEGQIVEDGNPQELLEKKDGLFKHMWEHQKKGFI